ncbi:MAG: hypothetical protein HOV87_28705 [Catenulispora sp.]|nr:hypothetical protein [Catenulispora sp.]
MIHARSVRLAAVAVLGGAVALATSACGGPMQAGAAAVVQGQRTSDRDLQSDVAAYVRLAEANGVAEPGSTTDQERASLANAQIGFLVQNALWQKVADDLGVKIGADADAELDSTLVQETRAAVGPQFHGSDNEAVALAFAKSQSANGLSPGLVPVFVHYQALIKAVIANQAAKLHVAADTQDPTAAPALQKAIVPMLDKAAKEIDVKISPRYGAFDAGRRQLVAADTSWIHPTQAQLDKALSQMQQQPQ